MNVEYMSVFPTVVWFGKGDLDNERLYNKCKAFSRVKETGLLSNVGGYQGEDFKDEELFKFILESIPQVDGKEFIGEMFDNVEKLDDLFTIFSWVNINGQGHRNDRHNHFAHSIPTFLSGVYYVKVPKDSGVIRFYDPRGPMTQNTLDQEYYFNSPPFQYLEPEEGQIILFPTWLDHDVTYNTNEEERVSIAFNVMIKKSNS